jgi:peptide/nickel transport system substrate-binding protein
MKRTTFWLFAVLMLAITSIIPAFAQEANPAAGAGGQIVEGNIGDDPSDFIPFISSDLSSSTVWDWMYPTIIALDDRTIEATPGAPDGMAESWEFDETGTKLTVKLRQDLTWGDGQPIVADDYMFAYNAVKSGQTSSPRTNVLYKLDDGTEIGGSVISAEKVDDYTIVFTLGEVQEDGSVKASCTALNDVNDITPVPAHIYGAPKPLGFANEDGSIDYAAMENDPYYVPKVDDSTYVTFGVFTAPYLQPGQFVSVIADQNYPDTELGYVSPAEWIYQSVDSTNVQYELFVNEPDSFTYMTIPANKQVEFRELNAARPEGEKFQVIEYPQNGYTYLGWNTADPNNPRNGRDENGELIDQGLHPIFGDVKVRQAMAYAVDVQAMVDGILQGNGSRLATHNHPGLSWVDPGLEPYPYDPEKAKELLAEAGWTDGNGDGLLECTGCKYATEVDPSFEGSPFTFTLQTNAGNSIREGVGETIKEQLSQIGITVDFQAIEFGTLLERMDAQDFDAIIIGWSLGLPFDSEARQIFGIGADIVGSGFNAGSYHNEELDQTWADAVSVPGCDTEARADLYKKAMQILYDEQPYMFLFSTVVMVAAQPNVENWDPLPYNAGWNLDAWAVTP